jgi:hypothetical protein
MAYGMRIWGANGALQMDENSFTLRIAFSAVVNNSGWTITNSTYSLGYQDFSVPGVTASNAVATLLPVGSYASTATQFEAEVLNGVVRVYNYNKNYPSGTWAATASSMRLMVMRTS